MFEPAWLEEKSSQPALLLLHSVGQARAFLKHRSNVLMLETQEQNLGSERAEDFRRCRRLLDRSATFWLAHQELECRKRKYGIGLLAPKPALPLPRVFNLNQRHGFDLNSPWPADKLFLRRVAFCSDALSAFGALVVPLPLEEEFIEKSFGYGSWEAILRQATIEKAGNLSRKWLAGEQNHLSARL